MIKKRLNPEFKKEAEVIEFRKLHRKKLYKGGNVSKPNFEMNENCNHEMVLCKVEHSQIGKTAREILTRTQAFNIVLELHKDRKTQVCNQGGINSVVSVFNSRYYYKGVRQMTESVLKHCTGTCKLKKTFQISTPPPQGIRSSHVMHELQCDLINVSCKKGIQSTTSCKHHYKYIMVTKDCFSKFCWLSPLKSKKGAEIAEVLQFLFEEHGAPCYLHTDNGTEFINEVVSVLCESCKVKVKHGRPYHPQSQGQVENLNRRVKICLSNFLLKFDEDRRADIWPSLLKHVAQFINHTWHHTIKNNPY